VVEDRPILSAEYRIPLLAKILQRGLSAIAGLLVAVVFPCTIPVFTREFYNHLFLPISIDVMDDAGCGEKVSITSQSY